MAQQQYNQYPVQQQPPMYPQGPPAQNVVIVGPTCPKCNSVSESELITLFKGHLRDFTDNNVNIYRTMVQVVSWYFALFVAAPITKYTKEISKNRWAQRRNILLVAALPGLSAVFRADWFVSLATRNVVVGLVVTSPRLNIFFFF